MHLMQVALKKMLHKKKPFIFSYLNLNYLMQMRFMPNEGCTKYFRNNFNRLDLMQTPYIYSIYVCTKRILHLKRGKLNFNAKVLELINSLRLLFVPELSSNRFGRQNEAEKDT